MLSWQSILRIGCQTERLAQLRAFAIIGVILLQRRSRITMPPCEYFTLFYIQCGVYTEFGIEPRLVSESKHSATSLFIFGIRFSHFVTCYFSPYKRIHHPTIFQFPSTNFSTSSNCEICVICVTLSRYSTATVAVTVSPSLFSTVLLS